MEQDSCLVLALLSFCFDGKARVRIQSFTLFSHFTHVIYGCPLFAFTCLIFGNSLRGILVENGNMHQIVPMDAPILLPNVLYCNVLLQLYQGTRVKIRVMSSRFLEDISLGLNI